MIYQSDQGFSTFDTITIVLSVVILSVIVVPILSHRLDSQNTDVAKRQAEEWSQKITSVEKLSDNHKTNSQGRFIASQQPATSLGNDNVGADPWGQPYRVQYVKNPYGQPVYVVVWSSGPNAVVETPESIMTLNSEGILALNFGGDDIGHIRAVR